MKILVIEDSTSIMDFISIALKMGFPGSRIVSTHLGSEGIELVEKEKPDIVLLDLELPDSSGFEVLTQIRAFSDVPIIIETVRDNEPDLVKGLMLGADDYIGKPFGQLELMARIKTVLKRVPAGAFDNPCFGDLYLDIPHHTLHEGTQKTRLTPTESTMIEAFMKKPQNTLSLDDLAELIWGADYPGAEETLKTYIRRLRAKVESVSNGKITISAKPGLGFVLKLT
jgi:two-component system KDP operon response regulator KdpE